MEEEFRRGSVLEWWCRWATLRCVERSVAALVGVIGEEERAALCAHVANGFVKRWGLVPAAEASWHVLGAEERAVLMDTHPLNNPGGGANRSPSEADAIRFAWIMDGDLPAGFDRMAGVAKSTVAGAC